MNPLQFCTIAPLSAAYQDMAELRTRVLLEPIGIPRSYINPEKETADILIGAYLDKKLVGCCILTRVGEDTVQLRQMAVAPELQKKGVGRQMLSFAEGMAKKAGFNQLMMHARDSVIPFYQKCGYTISGAPFSEVGIPHHPMQKKLVAEGC